MAVSREEAYDLIGILALELDERIQDAIRK